VDIKPEVHEIKMVRQQVYLVEKNDKASLLCQLIHQEPIAHALIFTRTRRGADKLVKALNLKGIRSQAIHGDKSQSQRQRVLEDFKTRKVHMLVATDVASRGIDVKDLSHVINFDMPEGSDTYTHRIGRTGRAGAEGVAFSFCSREEQGLLKEIQKFSAQKISVVQGERRGGSDNRKREVYDESRPVNFDEPQKAGFHERRNVHPGVRRKVSFGQRRRAG
jgi:ATP-dependent RNA helicase RhlE